MMCCASTPIPASMLGRWLIGALLALLLSGCGSTERIRYRMTIEVDTPQGVRTGSAVREVTSHAGESVFFAQGRGSATVRGQAVMVDLPGGRTLYALLSGGDGNVDYGSRIADRTLRSIPAAQPSPHHEGVIAWQRFAELWPTHPATIGLVNMDPLPMLVTFSDVRDPESVVRVDPDDLAASFGLGTRLRRITVQITDDEVTTGIERRLGTQGIRLGQSLDSDFAPTTTPTLAQQLGSSDFTTEALR